jgi:5-methylcytosine-specific restriction endonuclease McrA
MSYAAYQLPRKCVQKPKKRRHTKRKVLEKIVRQVFEYFEFECAYCGREADGVDHIIPRHHGGDNSPNNLVAACLPCNQAKGTKSIESWFTEKTHSEWTQYRCDRIKEWRSL